MGVTGAYALFVVKPLENGQGLAIPLFRGGRVSLVLGILALLQARGSRALVVACRQQSTS